MVANSKAEKVAVESEGNSIGENFFCRSPSDPWSDGKASPQHLAECQQDGCERCGYLIDGLYMACDNCGHWGEQDSAGWVMAKGVPFCSEKCAREWFGVEVEIE